MGKQKRPHAASALSGFGLECTTVPNQTTHAKENKMEVEKNVVPADIKHTKGVSTKHLELFNLGVRGKETKRGDAVIVPHSKANYTRYVKSLLPRWNKTFAPKRWVHSADYRNGKRVIVLQRSV